GTRAGRGGAADCRQDRADSQPGLALLAPGRGQGAARVHQGVGVVIGRLEVKFAIQGPGRPAPPGLHQTATPQPRAGCRVPVHGTPLQVENSSREDAPGVGPGRVSQYERATWWPRLRRTRAPTLDSAASPG